MILRLIPFLLLFGCDAGRPGTASMADLAQAISARTLAGDWQGLKALSLNPDQADASMKSVCMLPRTGGLRAWAFKAAGAAPAIWGEAVAFEGLEECDFVIQMSWTVPTKHGIGNVDLLYPVVEQDGRYLIRFLKPKS